MNPHKTILRSIWIGVWIIVCLCPTWGAAGSDAPAPAATLDLTQLLKGLHERPAWATVTFASETRIAVGVCQLIDCAPDCALSVVEWENGKLHRVAQTSSYQRGAFLHAAPGGQILAMDFGKPYVLYAPDLASSREIPKTILPWLVSPSGNAIGEWKPGPQKSIHQWAEGSWNIYQLSDSFPVLHQGKGELRAVGDDIVVFQSGETLNLEKFDGTRISSFKVPRIDSRHYYDRVATLPGGRLYLDSCGSKTLHIVKTDGHTARELRTERECDWGEVTSSSADGSLLLFDFNTYELHGLRRVFEAAGSIMSAGMVGSEVSNREKARVIDVQTGNLCFAWQQAFPNTGARIRSAALSPSGRFVATIDSKTLSIYQVACQSASAASK